MLPKFIMFYYHKNGTIHHAEVTLTHLKDFLDSHKKKHYLIKLSCRISNPNPALIFCTLEWKGNNVLVDMALHEQHQENARQNCSPRRAFGGARQSSSCSGAHTKESTMLRCTSSHFPAAVGDCGSGYHAKSSPKVLRRAHKPDSEASKALHKVLTNFNP